jgi:hypothetical protein
MADILGPLGICLGGFSFILNTVPTTVRFTHDISERKQQIRQYEYQFQRCEARFNKWEIHWRAASNGPEAAIVLSSLDDIVDLATTIDRAIQRNTITPDEQAAWEQMKNRLREGDFYLPKFRMPDFCNKLRHALWRKSVLEGWILRLEKAISIADESFQEYYQSQTAGHYKGSADIRQANDLGGLKSYFDNLASLGTDMYNECIATEKHSISTHSWALGLPTPTPGNTIADWKSPSPLNIEAHFAVRGKTGDKHFHLRTCYKVDQEKTHVTQGRILRLVQAKAEHTRTVRHPNDAEAGCMEYSPKWGPQEITTKEERIPGVEECHDHQGSARRTIPIESIIRSKPDLLKKLIWLVSRPNLVYGITEWTLLLWKTPWLQNLSCSGLAIEMGTCTSTCAKQVLEVPDCGRKADENMFRLENLGLVLAQLILGVLIRPAEGSNFSRYEQHMHGEWKKVSLSDINMRIYQVTQDRNVRDAIYFCLRPDPEISKDDFKQGYIYICIDRIFEPFVLYGQ